MKEFIPILNYPKYGINKNGDVINFSTNTVLRGMHLSGKYNSGYVVHILYNSQGSEAFSLRKLLAMTFLDDYVEGCQVELIDKSKPLNADNIRIRHSKINSKHVIHTRCRVECEETGQVFESLSELSRHICGDTRRKCALSMYIHNGWPYKGLHYRLMDEPHI